MSSPSCESVASREAGALQGEPASPHEDEIDSAKTASPVGGGDSSEYSSEKGSVVSRKPPIPCKSQEMATSDKKKVERRKYTTWSIKDDRMMLNFASEAIRKGNAKTRDGKIRSDIWNEIIKKYNESVESKNKMTRKNVDNRMKTWRLLYKKYKIIENESGWGWNYIHGRTNIPNDVWSEFVKKYPECAQCKGRACHFYEQLAMLFESNATSHKYSKQPPIKCDGKEPIKCGGVEKDKEVVNVIEDDASPGAVEVPMDLDFGIQANPCTKPCVEKQPQPAAELQILERIAKVEQQILELVAKVEQQKLERFDKRTKEVIQILYELKELSQDERFKAMRLLQNLEMRDVFLHIPPESRVEWLRFNL